VNGGDVRYGVYLPPFGPFGDPAALVGLAVRAEAAGWDGVFVWDHLVSGAMPIADPWTTLAAIAQVTTRVLLGPMVTPLARRRPWVVARHASTVSRLSGGRLILGAGLGSDESGDFSRFGEPASPRARSAMLDEGIEILRALWSGESCHHDGAQYQVTLEPSAPEPYPIPIWAASTAAHPRVIRRAAACEGIFPNPPGLALAPDQLAGILAAVHRAGVPAGRVFDVAVAGNASPAWPEPATVDLRELAQAGMTWWMESLIHFDPLELSLEIVDAGPPRI
jgi:alkanesulfonate monooxygenase SsuD/methylene tetrahydromethanopterin reductase-like flavin-dependent oxidoreductase (luciferase family)